MPTNGKTQEWDQVLFNNLQLGVLRRRVSQKQILWPTSALVLDFLLTQRERNEPIKVIDMDVKDETISFFPHIPAPRQGWKVTTSPESLALCFHILVKVALKDLLQVIDDHFFHIHASTASLALLEQG